MASLDFSNSTPAAPTGSVNVGYQKSVSGDDVTISSNVPIATASILGVVKPDGTTISVSSGVISAVGGGGGSIVQLEQHVASSSAELDFTASFASAYKEYLVEIRDFVPATSGAAPLLQFSTNGGTSYDTSSIYDWGQTTCALGTASFGGNAQANVNGIVIWGDSSRVGPSSSAIPGLSAWIKIYNPGSASNHKIVSGGGVGQYNGNGSYFSFNFGGRYKSTSAANAFRVIMTSGNISIGTVTCYGITG